MNRRYGLLGLVLAGCVAASPFGARNREYDWARNVLLGAEIGDARNAVVRWQHPARYLVVEAPPRVRQAVDTAYSILQEALRGSLQMEIEHVASSDERIGSEGYITMFAIAPCDANGLAQKYGAQAPQADADGWFTIVWNRSFELTRAVVFVAPDLPDRWLRHTALEEMFQALGPSNDSSMIKDSLLFESSTKAGSHDYLARVDLQVLRLLYQGLQPGDRAGDIEQAMQRSWVFVDGVTRAKG
jgi:hypothetical protein